jgi:hypothetical protein
MSINVHSAKSKGRGLQQRIAALLLSIANETGHPLTERDVRSTSMGVGGPDLQLSEAAAAVFGLDFEAKNEANPGRCGNISTRYRQLSGKNTLPTVCVFKQSSKAKRGKPLYVMNREVRATFDLSGAIALEAKVSSFDLYTEFWRVADTYDVGDTLEITYSRSKFDGGVVAMSEERFGTLLAQKLLESRSAR